MLKVTICVGSSCSMRGSDELAAALERLIEKENLGDQIELVGAFCMEQCSTGISVRVDDRQYKEIRAEDVDAFFYNEINPYVKGGGNA